MVTTTYQTYRQVGIREDLSNEISDISPEETPAFTMIQRGKPCRNTMPEWQIDALAAANGANKAVEGADAAYLTASPTTRVRNYTQISTKAIIVSGTADAVDTAGREEEEAYQIAKRGREMKRDMEAMITGNNASVAGGSATARVSAGMEAWLTTNSVYGGTAGATDGANGGYTAAGTVTAATDGSSSNLRTITEAMLKSVLGLCWTAGGQPTMVIVGAYSKRKISAFSGITTKYSDFGNNPASSGSLAIIAAADIYLHDFGKVKIVPDRFSRARTALVLDTNYWSLRYLRPMKVEALAKTGDATKKQLLCEWTLQSKNQAASAKIADLVAA
jgi:hypothetical protein